MKIRDYIDASRVVLLQSKEKEPALRELVAVVHEQNMDEHKDTIHEQLLARESLMSTGIGLGIAVPHIRTDLLTADEKGELETITRRWRQLELERKVLKKKYYNLWNAESYRSRKHRIDKSFEELDKRRKEIRENGLIRLRNRQQEVIKLCDEQLMRVTCPREGVQS